ncbi:MAG: hypothetical protein KatS3mg035_1355 [Bacteroidia bacterium]|nr:MAG: hypothetical protein KatS3mg035_1355 [Bacteroidia bacterium]
MSPFLCIVLLLFYMLNAQNQCIIRNSVIHCQRGVLNCNQCQEIFEYKYMLLDFNNHPMHASPLIEHEGNLKSYQVIKIFSSLAEAQQYAHEQNVCIQVSDLDTDKVLQPIQKKVRELGWHITIDADKQQLKIFSVYPVKELETQKQVLPEIVFSLRPLNSKISYALFYTEKYKVINKVYYGVHSKMNPVQDNPKEDALQKVRDLENFLMQFYFK